MSTHEYPKEMIDPGAAAPVAPAGMEDPVTVPRGLLGAACAAISKKADAPNTLAKLREFTVGSKSAASLAPAVRSQLTPLGRLMRHTLSSNGKLWTCVDVQEDGPLAVPQGTMVYVLIDPTTLNGAAPVAPAPAPPWLPIETAPQDGRTILLGRYNELGKWRTMRGQWMSQDCIDETWEDPESGEPGWFETCVEADKIPNCWPINPTHWMPLPGAPEAA